MKVSRFLNRRLPLSARIKKFGEVPQPRHVGWLHTFGSILLFLLLLQLTTGAGLALYYAPTPDHAWESVRFIQSAMSTGVLRGLHYWSTSFLVVFLILHLLRVVFHGAYRSPREFTWISGLLLLVLVLAFAFTGFLLPWDQNGYWATQIGIEILETIPLGGPFLALALRAGGQIGALTLTRFYAIHSIILPGCLLLLVFLHLYLLRTHGTAPAPSGLVSTSRRLSFFPYQFFRDSVAVLGVFLVLLVLALTAPPEVRPLADPSGTALDPRPEWFFLPQYELLRWWGGPALIPAVLIPLAVFVFLMFLPFLDQSASGGWRRRRWPIGSVAALVSVGAMLIALSKIYHPVEIGESTDIEVERLPLPSNIPVGLANRGRELFKAERCLNCHKLKGLGGQLGPELTGIGEKMNLIEIRSRIVDPRRHHPTSQMPSYRSLEEGDLKALTEYLAAINPTSRED